MGSAQGRIDSSARIIILGAGCAGLGAAYRLHELGLSNFTVLEKASFPGGLAASFEDQGGFTWDIGGHVQFSHYSYFDELMNAALGEAWLEHIRQSYIWMCGKFLPYPFQNNLRHLPKKELAACLLGLLRAQRNGSGKLENFRDWIGKSFGQGIAEVFLEPYNFKVWAHPLEMMSYQWIGERVATVDFERVLENVLLERDDPAWGPNSTFRFPLRGGTGAIWRAVAGLIPEERLRYDAEVKKVDVDRKTVETDAGEEYPYDVLISTAPLDVLARLAERQDWANVAGRLRYSTSHIVGVGLNGQAPPHMRDKNWMYFPESDCPFYRVTVFSNYSPNNVPEPGKYWSLMSEVSESPFKPVDTDALVADVIAGMKNTRLIESEGDVASVWTYTAKHGYPTPTVDRDQHIHCLLESMEQSQIFSRGRFGAWKYEVANQDHSCMQGVEVVDRLLNGVEEATVWSPNLVNSGKRR